MTVQSIQAPALGVVVLAAGRSTRMGTPKMLLPWRRTTVIGHLLQQWARLRSTQITVVCAVEDSRIAAELDRLLFPPEHRIYNPKPDLGMFSSICSAALWEGWATNLTHWAVVLGDQPHLNPATLEALIRFAASHADVVCQPSRGLRPKHPVIVPATSFRALRSTKASNLKEFLTGYEVALCELEDPALDWDLDTPEDYERALRLAAATG